MSFHHTPDPSGKEEFSAAAAPVAEMNVLVDLTRERVERLLMFALMDSSGQRLIGIDLGEVGDDVRLRLILPLAALGDLIERLQDAGEVAARLTSQQFRASAALMEAGCTEEEWMAFTEQARRAARGRA